MPEGVSTLCDLLKTSIASGGAFSESVSGRLPIVVLEQDTVFLLVKRQWAERLVRAVHALFPANPKDEVDSWPRCQRLLEQAQVCDSLIQQYHFQHSEGVALLKRTGSYLRERGMYTLAEPLLLRALRIQE